MTTTPEAEIVRSMFDYRDGQLIYKNEKQFGGRTPGAVAGSVTKRGYVNVRFNGRMMKAHRLVFLWHHGWWPELVDHIDGDRSNNRIENLRACDKSQNGMNRHVVLSATGVRNVYRRRNTYYVSIVKGGKQLSIGKFKELADAARAAEAARQHHFGEFA